MHELRRIDPTRTARLLAIIYAVLFSFFAILAVPMLLFAPQGAQESELPKGLFLVMLILYPIFGAGMGWLTGQITTRIYNLAAKKFGGLLIEVTQVGSTTG